AGVGFDWEQPGQVLEKMQEELEELNKEIDSGDQDKIESEFGDVLFSLVNYARFLKINPENALERTNKKFIHRFKHLEGKAKEKGQSLTEMSLEEMDVYWNEAKEL
ncbi:MAG: nucleoside triphosphate pyrophosphohydrolase, partial [Flavobacteriaceae bacterium]|nr:nucleoside triphosphate pyrophosphohydrolase [Flavobacteriaceae bacterium]